MDFRYMDAFLDHLTNERHYPGVDCIVTVRGKEVYRYGRGIAEIETGKPLEPHQLYNICSATKVITCTAAMQLVEQGKLCLRQPLYEIFPEYRHITVKEIGGVRPAKSDITIGDLFAMTAGFSYERSRASTDAVISANGGKAPLRQIVRAMASDPLEFDPGERWLYSLCHDVLGAVIEEVSGMPFGEYLKKNIFDPLGMVETGFNNDGSMTDRIAPLYQRSVDANGAEHLTQIPKVRRNFGPGFESGGGGLLSSVDDYIKFMVALCAGGVAPDGTRILSQSSVDLMRVNRLNARQLADYGHPGQGYGLGVRVTMDPAAAQTLVPVEEFGWGGAAGAHVHMDPVNQVCMYYAMHMLNNNGEYVHTRLLNILYGALDL